MQRVGAPAADSCLTFGLFFLLILPALSVVVESASMITAGPGPKTRLLSWLLVFLAMSAGYLYSFPQPSVFYAGVVMLHAAVGVIAGILLLAWLSGILPSASAAICYRMDPR